MNLKAFSDGCRVWIEDVDTSRDDPSQIHARFRVPHGPGQTIPKRAEERLLKIAETMAEAVNREHGQKPKKEPTP